MYFTVILFHEFCEIIIFIIYHHHILIYLYYVRIIKVKVSKIKLKIVTSSVELLKLIIDTFYKYLRKSKATIKNNF